MDLQGVDGLVAVHRPNLCKVEFSKIDKETLEERGEFSRWCRGWGKLPWSIRLVKKKPNTWSFHSIAAQLSNPSPKKELKIVTKCFMSFPPRFYSPICLRCVWIVWRLGCSLCLRRYPKSQFRQSTTRWRSDSPISTRLSRSSLGVPVAWEIDWPFWRLRFLFVNSKRTILSPTEWYYRKYVS